MKLTHASNNGYPPRTALIGCGRWGRNIARNLHQLGALELIVDPNPTVLEGVRAQFPNVRSSSDIDHLIADETIRACVVAAPAADHYRIGRRLLEAGKDVLVEKPLALTVEDGNRLTEIARSNGRILMVGHVLEYHPALMKLRDLVEEGELGTLQYMYSTRLNLGRIRTEENSLWSFAPHDIHTLLELTGQLPVEVACHGGTYLSSSVADVTMSMLQFPSGVQAHVFVSWLHPYKEHRFVVVGSEKMAVFDDTLPDNKLQLFAHRVEWEDGIPETIRGEPENVPYEPGEPLLAECRHFLECVERRDRPRTDGESGVRVLEVLERCQDSLDQGGVPLRMEEDAGATSVSFEAHPTATIDPGAEIGTGTRIWHYAHISPGARIGDECVLGQNVFVADAAVIGNRVKVQNNVAVYGAVTLEDDVFCGPSMVFTNVSTPRSAVSRKHAYEQTLVQRGATLGANSTIVCGNTIGRFAMVGAGAVVTSDVPDHALVVGVPARIVGWVCECGHRLPLEADSSGESAHCPECGRRYSNVGGRLETRETVEASTSGSMK